MLLLKKIGSMFITKKRVIGWVSALALAGGAVAAGMQTTEFKEAVCSAPVLAPVSEAK
jgi:hypothetical protein